MKLTSIFIFIALYTCSLMGYAQQDPAITSLTMSPATVQVGGALAIAAEIGNSGDTPISGVGDANRMAFTITLNDGVTLPGGMSNISGTILDYFDVTYNAADNTIDGIQKEGTAIPASTFYTLTVNAIAQEGLLTAIGNIIPNPSSIRARQTQDNDDLVTEAALPVTLTQFSVTREGESASLQWQTTEEVNSDRFEVERSNDSKSWRSIATVEAQRNSASLQNYAYVDVAPENGTSYYRLKMVDLDGTYEFSNIVSLQFYGRESIVISPNPVISKITIRGTSSGDVERVEIRNTAGQILYQSTVLQEIDMESLPSGMYIVAITKKGGSVSAHKVIKR